MRPSMTTNNAIVINTLNDVTYVSINAIFNQDSIPFVYTTNQTRQIVVLGETNDKKIIVKQGLSPGDKVYVSIPENSDTWKMVGEELIEKME
jgi:multidrug efflux pump subunit AcrA (membrane-fusion protein)